MVSDLRSPMEPGEIFHWTGEPGDRVDQRDMVLAGMLAHPNHIITMQQKKMYDLGARALRQVLLTATGPSTARRKFGGPAHVREAEETVLTAGNAARSTRRLVAPVSGAELTLAARELREPAWECREEHLRMHREMGWLRQVHLHQEVDDDLARRVMETLERHGMRQEEN